jgi:hypothetical protein
MDQNGCAKAATSARIYSSVDRLRPHIPMQAKIPDSGILLLWSLFLQNSIGLAQDRLDFFDLLH